MYVCMCCGAALVGVVRSIMSNAFTYHMGGDNNCMSWLSYCGLLACETVHVQFVVNWQPTVYTTKNLIEIWPSYISWILCC